MLWLRECPFDDQGLIRPLATNDGAVVLQCDECATVWCRPEDVDAGTFVLPEAPDWAACGVRVAPGTTRWARPAELAELGWDELPWHDDVIDPA